MSLVVNISVVILFKKFIISETPFHISTLLFCTCMSFCWFPYEVCPPKNRTNKQRKNAFHPKIDTFKQNSCNDISEIVINDSKATYSLDSVPIRALVGILPEIFLTLLHIVNLFLSSGLYPDALNLLRSNYY